MAVGSGEKGISVDRLVARDALGLPYIPGTSLAGVLRHQMEVTGGSQIVMDVFGFQKEQSGQGSRLSISSAHLLSSDGKTALEGLRNLDENDDYLKRFQKLPNRDHVRITHRGAAANQGKFDEELVPKGTRFVFTLRLSGSAADEALWQSLLQAIHHPMFRLGAGTRKGFGKFLVVDCEARTFNLTNQADLSDYLEWGNSLNAPLGGQVFEFQQNQDLGDWIRYNLTIKPHDFFLFGAGHGDGEVDSSPKTEGYFDWSEGTPIWHNIGNEPLLIPATSIKGAIAHRVAWHYNLLNEHYVDDDDDEDMTPIPEADIDKILNALASPVNPQTIKADSKDPVWVDAKRQIEDWDYKVLLEESPEWKSYVDQLNKYLKEKEKSKLSVGENNAAVKALFGFALDSDESGARGNVILGDVYRYSTIEKIFNHVSIDRFTGGARDGMLFQEKVASTDEFGLDIYVKKDALEDQNVLSAFETALDDICRGKLALGGGTTKGHGIFEGSWTKNKL